MANSILYFVYFVYFCFGVNPNRVCERSWCYDFCTTQRHIFILDHCYCLSKCFVLDSFTTIAAWVWRNQNHSLHRTQSMPSWHFSVSFLAWHRIHWSSDSRRHPFSFSRLDLAQFRARVVLPPRVLCPDGQSFWCRDIIWFRRRGLGYQSRVCSSSWCEYLLHQRYSRQCSYPSESTERLKSEGTWIWRNYETTNW